MEIPPWLNTSPDLFLNAARAGSATGSEIANRYQQAANQQAQMQQQANLANLQSANEANSLMARLQAQEAERNAAIQFRSQDLQQRLAEMDKNRDQRNMFENQRLGLTAALGGQSQTLRQAELEARLAQQAMQRDNILGKLNTQEANRKEASSAITNLNNGSNPRNELKANPNLAVNPFFQSYLNTANKKWDSGPNPKMQAIFNNLFNKGTGSPQVPNTNFIITPENEP